MKKEIREVKQGIVRVTTVDERWYARTINDQETGLPVWQYVPSVTWIAEHYPKGLGFYKWLANTGWDEAQALKEAAGDKGSKVHTAISALLAGTTVKIDDAVLNPSSAKVEFLTLEEYQAVMSFAAWHKVTNPELVAQDVVIWNDVDSYAGTVDAVFRLAGGLWIIDFKTSKAVWPSHRMQVSAYKHANLDWKDARLGILQLGYERTQLGYKFTEVEDCYDLFIATKKIWQEETRGQVPAQKDYPLSITLAPAAPPVADAGQEPNTGGGNGSDRRGAVADGVREGGRGRVVGGHNRGGPVRRAPGVQVKK